jgi:hypothetical protein
MNPFVRRVVDAEICVDPGLHVTLLRAPVERLRSAGGFVGDAQAVIMIGSASTIAE